MTLVQVRLDLTTTLAELVSFSRPEFNSSVMLANSYLFASIISSCLICVFVCKYFLGGGGGVPGWRSWAYLTINKAFSFFYVFKTFFNISFFHCE